MRKTTNSSELQLSIRNEGSSVCLVIKIATVVGYIMRPGMVAGIGLERGCVWNERTLPSFIILLPIVCIVMCYYNFIASL